MVNTIFYKSVNIFCVEEEKGLISLLSGEMERRHLSLRDVANIVGLSHPIIAKILDGEKPSFDTCIKLVPLLHKPDVEILRAAGLLKPVPESTAQKEELLYLFDQLPEQEKKSLLRFIRATLDAIAKE